MYKKIMLLSVVLIGVGGCSFLNEKELGDRSHKEEGPQLQYIMRDLNTIVGNNQKSELEREDDRKREALYLVDAILTFAKKVEDRSHPLKSKYIKPENKDAFYKHLGELTQKSKEIKETVNAYEMDRLDQKIIELEAICISCHKDLGVTHVQNLF